MKMDDAIALYGADAAEWLLHWDRGDIVHTIEMGGISPGYEQCIQIMVAEILRWFLKQRPDPIGWHEKDNWKSTLDALEKYAFADETIKRLGPSGAQWSVAVNLAANLYERGPVAVMTDERVADRRIQVKRDFP